MTHNVAQVLSGHVSPETAYVVEDWPYGAHRTQNRFWVETSTKGRKKGEQRVCNQTLNPKTGRWNKPKRGTYSPIAVLYIEADTGKLQWAGLSWYDQSEERVTQFVETFREAMGEHEVRMANTLLALGRAGKRIKWEIVTDSQETQEEREARKEEEGETMRKLVAYEFAKAQGGEGVK